MLQLTIPILSMRSAKLSKTNAKIGDKSKPPSGGIIPLKKFRYGSVIADRLIRIGLLQSRFGNQVSKTLIINRVE